MNIYQDLERKNPQASLLEDFDEAYLGYAYKDELPVAVYDYYTILDMVIDGIKEDEHPFKNEDEIFDAAHDHIEVNIIESLKGPYAPIVMYKELYDE